MATYIKKNSVMAMLKLMKQDYKAKNAKAGVGIVDACAEAVRKLEEVTVEEIPVPTAKKVRQVEAFFPGGDVGRDVIRCGKCGAQIGARDNYCRECGRRLINP